MSQTQVDHWSSLARQPSLLDKYQINEIQSKCKWVVSNKGYLRFTYGLIIHMSTHTYVSMDEDTPGLILHAPMMASCLPLSPLTLWVLALSELLLQGEEHSCG